MSATADPLPPFTRRLLQELRARRGRLIAFVMIVANMDWGRRLIEQATAQVSGGQVTVAGISGHFPAKRTGQRRIGP